MIGIIGAMDVEVSGFKQHMQDISVEKHAFFEFTKGTIEGTPVVVVMCGIGKVSAAMCAQILIDKYNPEVVINSGVAGALEPRFSLGDIAVANGVAQHDIDTTVFGDPMGYITNLGLVKIPVKNEISSILAASAQRIENTLVLAGTIVSGDQFISTPYQKNLLKDNFDAIATEMEGAAVGHVCYSNNVDFGVIRAISDTSDGDAIMEYDVFCKAAAEKTIRIVVDFVKNFK